MKMFLSFVKLEGERDFGLISNTITIGLSETTDDRFAHSASVRSEGEFLEFVSSEKLILPSPINMLLPLINLTLNHGASLIEFVVEKDYESDRYKRSIVHVNDLD